MEISSVHSPRNPEHQPSVPATRSGKDAEPAAIPAQPDTTDQLRLTHELRELHRVQQMAALLPEVREEKLNQLREAIDSGRYRVESEKVADKIIQDVLLSNRPPSQSS